ncbi:MAG: hypothetical protein JWR12_3000 [Mucilaginibacter sp.]|nr:hypothetical protein [Mucilaginibacter sp.]
MERKRIIVETGEGPDVAAHLIKIEKAISDLEEKTLSKWLLPVLLIVITSVMTAANFFISRHYNNEDVYGNKLKEKIAELRATETVGFFKTSLSVLDTLNQTFHTLCQFDIENKADNQFNTEIIKLNNLIDQQLTIDNDVAKAMNSYKGFLNVNEFDIGGNHLSLEARLTIYAKSEILYLRTISTINKSLTDLTAR